MADRSRPDQNNQFSLIAVSNADGNTPVTLWADPTTHSLVTSAGGGSGTQYTTGAAVPGSPVGGAIVFGSGANWQYASATNPFPVQLGGLDISGNPTSVRTDSTGRLKISHGQPAATTGTLGALNAISAVASDGFSDAIFYFSGTTVQTVTFEQSADSTDGTNGTWYPVLASNQGLVAVSASTAALTSVHTYRVSAPAASWIHAKTTAYTSGSSSVQMVTTTAMAQSQVTNTPSTTAVTLASTTLLPSATVGGTTTPFFAAAMTAKTAVKASAGSMLHVNFYNPNTTDVYIQTFNTALASVTLGTTAPIRSFWVPAKGSYTDDFAYYHRYSTAITIGPWSVVDNSAGAAPALGIVTNVDFL